MSGRAEVELAGVRLRNPVIAASGTVGLGFDAEGFEFSAVGAFVAKTITLKPREGNPPPRVWETPSGMLNSIGLENPGLERFLAFLPRVLELGCPVVASVAGESPDEYARLCEALAGEDLAGVELNLSCPNVERGGISFGREPEAAARVVRACRKVSSVPLIAKLTPAVSNILAVGAAVADAGADAVCAVNTLPAAAVDVEERKLFQGGLSGPAMKPVALRAVRELAPALPVPVVGCGGVASGRDAAEFILAGAAAVEVGTANLVEPNASARVARELERILEEMETTANELRGRAEEWPR